MRKVYFILWLLLFPSLERSYAAESSTIKVGVILPLSGNAASYGSQFKEGLELAAKGKPFQLIYEDSKFENPVALSAFRKLTDIDKVDFLISFGGATCEVLNREAQKKHLVHFAAGCNTATFKLELY